MFLLRIKFFCCFDKYFFKFHKICQKLLNFSQKFYSKLVIKIKLKVNLDKGFLSSVVRSIVHNQESLINKFLKEKPQNKTAKKYFN
jgi:hypothetical protein